MLPSFSVLPGRLRTPRSAALLLLSCLVSACVHHWEQLTPGQLTATAAETEVGKGVLLDEMGVRYLPDPKTGEAAAEVTAHMRTRFFKSSVQQPSSHWVGW